MFSALLNSVSSFSSFISLTSLVLSKLHFNQSGTFSFSFISSDETKDLLYSFSFFVSFFFSF